MLPLAETAGLDIGASALHENQKVSAELAHDQ